MRISTYLRFQADYPAPEPGHSGAWEVASSLAAGLRTKGFTPSEPKDEDFAHFFSCPSGSRDYEIMAAFDFAEDHTWEVSCRPLLGLFSRHFGKTDEKELSALIRAVHDAMQSNPRVKEMLWYASYGDRSNGSPDPIQDDIAADK